MDVRAYFQSIRSLEREFPEEVVVVSLATPDGGREGRAMELNRSLAAKMVVDRRVRRATPEEIEEYHQEVIREQEEFESRFIEPRTQFIVAVADARKKIQQSKKMKEKDDGTV